MAGKETSPAAAKEKESHSPPSSSGDVSRDEMDMERLRILNHLLVDKMVEQRQQMAHLRSHLAGLSDDHAFLAGVEHDVSRLVVSFGLAERARRVQADVGWLAGTEERARFLQERVDSMAEELRSRGERLEMVVGEKDEIKKALDLALSEKDSSSMDLDRKEKELRVLEAKIRELEIGMAEVRANLEESDIKRKVLVEQGNEWEEAINSLLQEKASMETSLDESRQLVESMERKMEEAIKIKQEEVETVKAKNVAIAAKVSALEAEHRILVKNNQMLEGKADGLKAAIFSMMTEEDGLRKEIAELKKKNAEVTEELRSEVAKEEAVGAKLSKVESEFRSLSESNHTLRADLNSSKSASELLKKEKEGLRSRVAEMEKTKERVTEELERLQAELGALEKEKEGILLDHEERMMVSAEALDGLRTRMGEIEREKDVIEGMRAVQQSEIDTLQEELQQFRSTVHELQVRCNDYTNTNTQLQIERDSARRDLDLQKVEEHCLRVQIEELKERNREFEEETQELRRALGDFARMEEEWKVQSEVLKEEKASTEKELIAAQQTIEDMERKIRAADENSRRALSLLKDTKEMVHGLVEGKESNVERRIGTEEERDEELLPFVNELEAIETAFKGSVGKSKDMNTELEDLRRELAAARKKRGVSKWLCPPTTLLAAISFAYALAAISFAYAAQGR